MGDGRHPLMKRATLGRIARVLVSVLLVAYVLTRIPFADRPGVEVRTRDGRTLLGEVASREEGVLVLRPRVGAVERIPVAEIEAEAPALVEPGFLTVVSGLDKARFAPFALLSFVPLLVTAHRWTVLLRVAGVPCRAGYVFHLAYIGAFFNQFMLGSTGGDLLKAILVARGTDRKARAVASILVDRVVGMSALALVAAGAIAFNLHRAELREAALVVGGLLCALVFATVVYFNPWLRSRAWVGALVARLPFAGVRSELDTAFRLYLTHKAALAWCLGISVASHLCAMVQAWGIARSVGVQGIPFLDFCSYVPVIMIFAALPISVGGLGVGEAGWVRLFGPLGMSAAQAVTVSLLVRLVTLVVSLSGGAFLASGRERREIEEARRIAAHQEPVAT